MTDEAKKISRLAVLSALSIILMFMVRFPLIPAAPFLEYEPGDVPALIAAFLFGPGAGLLVTLVVSIIQAVTVSAASGWIGAIMHFVATGTMVVVAGFIYKRFHNFNGAVVALVFGSLCMTTVMVPLNLFFTTKFMSVPVETVRAMIFPIIVPFNLLKATLNSFLTVIVYKPMGNFLRVGVQQAACEKR